ncbi:protein kinase [Actinoplanes sp. NPDC051470]|uniref:protein kinase domain-containing protein n=1 Tax=Actinoplanes sp. NPDC051470 TaxID=3157224 RepID=UPI0034272ADE
MSGGRHVDPLATSDPERLGEYRLLGRLGAGGMGVVFLAENPGGERVAIKLVHPGLLADPEVRGRFRSEVGRARQVPASCTAAFLDADLDHDPPYLVVEYVDGPSLGEVVTRQGPLAPEALRPLAFGVATALAGIHGAGVIHRDLKPGNVLLAADSPRVIDFGIARPFELTSQHTRTDMMVGTVAYMAPERFSADPDIPITPAADIFAWGCLVGYAAAGRTPFRGDSPQATAARIMTMPPRLDGVPDELREPVLRALDKDPANRPTAAELLALLRGESPGRPRLGAGRRVMAAAAVVLVLAAGATALILGRSEPDADVAVPAAVAPVPTLSPSSAPVVAPPVGRPSTDPVSSRTPAAQLSPPAAGGVKPTPDNPATTQPAASAPKGSVNTARRNLALNRPAFASSVESDHWSAGMAVDGDPATRWSSGFAEPEWLKVDLGATWRVTDVTVRWEDASAVSYRVELSTDGTAWTSVYSTTSGTGGVVTVPADGKAARYVRVYCLKRFRAYGFSIWDVEVR